MDALRTDRPVLLVDHHHVRARCGQRLRGHRRRDEIQVTAQRRPLSQPLLDARHDPSRAAPGPAPAAAGDRVRSQQYGRARLRARGSLDPRSGRSECRREAKSPLSQVDIDPANTLAMASATGPSAVLLPDLSST
jgi:hypothetical protein